MKASILIADDDQDIRLALSLLLTEKGYQIHEASCAKDILIFLQRIKPDLILLDMNFSRDTTSGKEGLELLAQIKNEEIPVILMTAWGSIELAVAGLQNGAVDFIEKPWNKHKLLNSIQQQLKLKQVESERRGFQQLLSQPANKYWICESKSMQALEQLVTQVANTDANVLILGENGTGKSILAERLHQMSDRSQQAFIAVNMAAIPESLFESELFGHQKGAFTDAKQNRVGRFQLANSGTIFLDEVGTLPLNLQPKLLRVLETGQFEMLGASHTQTTDARVISATNADLNGLVESGNFRQDLFYRLNTFIITLPPLRERQEDIAALAELMLERFSLKYKKSKHVLTESAIDKLKHHLWPGNIRELSHVIERAVLLANHPSINAEQVVLQSGETKNQTEVVLQPLDDAEKQLINKAMQVSSGQVSEAAKQLGISRNALYRRLDKYAIKYEC